MMDHEFKYPLDTKVIVSKKDFVQLRLKVKDKDEFLLWLKNYEDLNKLTIRLLRGFRVKRLLVVYKADYRCHRNTYPRKPRKTLSKKHTNCPVLILATVKRVVRYSRSKDPYMPEYPTTVVIKGIHNHSIGTASDLRFRTPSESTRQKFLHLFSLGYGVSDSLELYKNDITEEYGNSVLIEEDRAIIPDLKWVYGFYHKTFKEQYGESPTSLYNSLTKQVKKNTKQSKKCSLKKHHQSPQKIESQVAVIENTTSREAESPNTDCNEDNCTTPVLEKENVELDFLAFFGESHEADPTEFLVPQQGMKSSLKKQQDFNPPKKIECPLPMTENTTSREAETPNMDCNEDNCITPVLEKEKVESDFLAFFREGYEADPTGFLAPVAAFLKSVRSIKTKSGLYSALHSIG